MLIASALSASVSEKPEAFERTVERLARRVDEPALGDSSAEPRPAASQMAEAAPLVELWPVARIGLRREATRPAAERLAACALTAALQQEDPSWSMAILREEGQLALDRGDRAAAETAWTAMLRRILDSSAAGAQTKAVATPERFRQAARLARNAAANGLVDLSLRSLRGVLGGGPPVQPLKVSDERRRPLLTARSGDDESRNSIAQQVEETLAALQPSWQGPGVDAQQVYETLREIVLPEARPGEVFLYPRPMARGAVESPRSVGDLLARSAVRAGREDDLRRRTLARRDQPRAGLASLVLLGQVALARRDPKAVNEALAALAARLPKETAQMSAELACHTALPALASAETAVAALPVAEAALKALSAGEGAKPTAGLSLALARFRFARGKAGEGRKALRIPGRARPRHRRCQRRRRDRASQTGRRSRYHQPLAGPLRGSRPSATWRSGGRR